MKNVIKVYFYILPVFSLIGIVLSVFRAAYQDSYGEIFLAVGAVLDLFIVFFGGKHLLRKAIFFLSILMILSLIAGLYNGNELSRRYITDFTNPFFFFAKIYIFSAYWKQADFDRIIKYYIKVAFWGSLALLPFTYFLFNSAGATRMAIFPPMEIPLSYYMQSGGPTFFVSLLVILLYGKRAQLLGAIGTFLFYIIVFKKKQILRYLILLVVLGIAMNFVFIRFSDNLAIRRISTTIDEFTSAENNSDGIEEVGSDRMAEIEHIFNDMAPIDYVFGKGLGYEYLFVFGNIAKMKSNAHFTPVSLLSKYGIFFTLFFYIFIIRIFLKTKSRFSDIIYLTAFSTAIFILFESFFSYTVFVLPIFPVVISYMKYVQGHKAKLMQVK